MQKRSIIFILALMLVLILGGALPSMAGEVQYVSLTLDGNPMSMDVKPFIDANGRTIVPIAFVSQSMGYKVGWEGTTKKVTVEGPAGTLILTIGSKVALVNGKDVLIDTEAVIVQGRTMVPLRFVMEQMGATVGFESATKTVTLMSASTTSTKKVIDSIKIQVSSVLNVRTEPRTDVDNIIGKAENGSVYQVLSSTDGWYQIVFQGKKGWVSADYAVVNSYKFIPVTDAVNQEPSVDQEESIPTKVVQKVQVDVSYGSNLNVRSAASLHANILGKVARNDTFPYLGSTGSWYKIAYANTTGYVHQDYANIIEETQVDFSKIEATHGRINSPVVNVRSTPVVLEDNSNRITQVYFGQAFDIVDSTEEWYKVLLADGQAAWVVKRAMDLIDEYGNVITSEGIELTKLSKVLIVHTDAVNIRKGPTTDEEVLVRANQGDIFEILSTNGDWYRIALQDGRIGYVASWLGHTRTELKFEDQVEDRERTSLAAITDIVVAGNRLVVSSEEELLYRVFVLNDPARAMIQFGDVSVGKHLLGTTAVNRDGIESYEVRAYGENQIRLIVNFTKASSLDVLGDARLGQKKVSFVVEEAPLIGRTVMIDPGHGTYTSPGRFDVGATSPGGLFEYIINNDIAMDMTNRLIALGARVILTHTDTQLISLTLDERVSLANQSKADFFLSLHSDSYPDNPRASGMAVYYYAGNGNVEQKVSLATHILDGLTLYTGRANNGIKSQSFRVIKYTDIPSVLVEVGFLSNPEEEKLLQTSSFRSLAAEGMTQGILSYFEGLR